MRWIKRRRTVYHVSASKEGKDEDDDDDVPRWLYTLTRETKQYMYLALTTRRERRRKREGAEELMTNPQLKLALLPIHSTGDADQSILFTWSSHAHWTKEILRRRRTPFSLHLLLSLLPHFAL